MDNNNDDAVFEALLDFIKQSRRFDFTGYKRSSLQRRVLKQMQSHEIETYSDYFDYLQVHPEEFVLLFNTILINVTSFFRDATAWTYLQRQVIPRIISEKSDKRPIRIWSAGCASGEEAYSLAMLFAEALTMEKFRQQVKIYATDVDEEALISARYASYSAKDIQSVPEELRKQFFEAVGSRYVFRPDLRRAVIFGRHDLIQDAPISHLDLLVCRNTLMYFNAETQSKILDRFHFALNNKGFLFLGKAEMLLTHPNIFSPLNLQHRIFQPVNKNERLDRTLSFLARMDEDANNSLKNYLDLQEASFDSTHLAQLIIDVNGRLVLANTAARLMFNINILDLDRPLQDLEISYRPLELRSLIDEAYRTEKNIVINYVVRNLRDNQTQYLDVHLNLLKDRTGNLLGVSISFADVTSYHNLEIEVQKINQELETANEELQTTNEELETTNEELQSTNEELETTNEELQSTNEELETMNEELQSTNEELQTINDELRQRTTELNQTNAFLNSILTSFQAGVIVVDRKFNILSWNGQAEDLWGLRFDEVCGMSIFSLDIGLPVEQLREPMRNCLAETGTSQQMILQAVNRRGKTIQCCINYNPLFNYEKERQGVILLMEEVENLQED